MFLGWTRPDPNPCIKLLLLNYSADVHPALPVGLRAALAAFAASVAFVAPALAALAAVAAAQPVEHAADPGRVNAGEHAAQHEAKHEAHHKGAHG